MFKRRTRYGMDMDVEVDYSKVDQHAAEAGLDPEAVRATAIVSFGAHLERTGKEALQTHGQKFEGGGSDTTEDWSIATCQINFDGDAEGASAASQTWAAKVEQLGGTGRILRVRLQGADGTNLERYDEAYQRELMTTFESLPVEDQTRIDELMKPDS